MVNGMETAAAKTSATAMFANGMLELMFCKSLLLFTAMITKMFRKTVTGQMMIVAAAVILNKAVSLKIHVCIGGQNNSDCTWLEVLAAGFVLPVIILDNAVSLGTTEWIGCK